MKNFHELPVTTIDRETSEAVSVGFEVPEELKEKFKFKAGQYLTLEKEIGGKKLRRSYSICVPPNRGELKVTIKEIVDGTFSSWVNNKLKIGDSLNVFLPEGRFIYEAKPATTSKTYAAFAAGSGITPVMSILRDVLESEPQSKFVLVYGNKTPEQTIFYKELLELQKHYKDRFFVDFVYSQLKKEKPLLKRIKSSFFRKKSTKKEACEDKAIYGRIQRKTVNYILKHKFEDEDFEAFFLCGPQKMTEMATEVLKENDIPDDKIRFELFTTADVDQEKKFEKIDGKTKVTIYLDDEEVSFEMDRKTAVLDAVMDAGLDPPYSCQGGTCSSCIAQVVEGEASMASNLILTEKEVEEGLVLTCQSRPTTPKLVIDYDEI